MLRINDIFYFELGLGLLKKSHLRSMKEKNPFISVCMITYNQETYIGEAIESVLMQKCDFDFELIIADDASPDKTEQIVREYLSGHPNGEKIKYFRHSENLGMINNFIWSLKKCKGKYIALCEGDDYWTDPLKLQKQIDFLEVNADFVLTFHPVDVLFSDGRMDEDFGIKGIIEKSVSNIYDLAALGNYIHTPSVVFKNIIREFPNQFYNSPLGDFFLYMMLAEHGLVKRMDNKMSVYRYGVGIHSTSTNQKILISAIKTRRLLIEIIKDKTVKKILENKINNTLYWSIPEELRNFNGQNKEGYLIKNFSVIILFMAFIKKLIIRFRKFYE